MANYRTAYDYLISRARRQMAASGIVTKKQLYAASGEEANLQIHHVQPQKFGGKNTVQNMVLLSPDEHCWAHTLLNLALYQEKKFANLHTLNYTKVVSSLVDDLKHRNALRDLKVDVHILGKKQKPTTMSFAKAAELFAFALRKDVKVDLDYVTIHVFRAAMFNRMLCGYKVALHM